MNRVSNNGYRSRLRFSACFGFQPPAGASMFARSAALWDATCRVRTSANQSVLGGARALLPAARRFAIFGAGVGVAYACDGWSAPPLLVGVQSTSTNGGSSLSLVRPHSIAFKAAKAELAEQKAQQVAEAVSWRRFRGARAQGREVFWVKN